MDPTTALGAAALKSAGKIGAATVSHYKPVGVARVGSAEDRAQAYRRLLDAIAQHRLAFMYVDIIKTSAPGHDPLILEASRHLMTTGGELICALQGVQLCAPAYVIKAAQNAADAAKDEDQVGQAAYQQSQVAFLNAARHDLDYNPKRWQFWSKRKAKRFTTQKAALSLEGSSLSVDET